MEPDPEGNLSVDGEQQLHEDAQGKTKRVIFLGEPILALHPALRNANIPAAFSNHPLVQGQLFFTLPKFLLEEIIREVGESRFDSSLLQLEFALSGRCGNHSETVGYWNRWPIWYNYLRESPALAIDDETNSFGQPSNPAKIANVMRTAGGRLERFSTFSKGYAGWLTTNRVFLDEHDTLVTTWAAVIQKSGLDIAALSQSRGGGRPDFDPAMEPRWDQFTSALREFFVRWRLLGLAAPYLPKPIAPLMSGDLAPDTIAQIKPAGAIVFFPDTFPISSRDELRGMLEDALRGQHRPDHLAEWFDIIRSDNPAKSQIDRFARLFELQHYWHILHDRHPAAIDKKLGLIKQVMASFLGKEEQTIHQDLLFIKKRLGADWLQHRLGGQ